MFWKFNLLTTSHVDTLLDKEEVTLRELMDEDDILQECKAQNRKLIDFLVRSEMMDEMVILITTVPPEDMDEKFRFKYANTSCELLTSDVSQINDKLAGDEELVKKLYSFLEAEGELNPLLASFFSKVMGLLITRKSEMIFSFLKEQNDFVGSLLKHIGTSAIMDLLLRLITCIESVHIRRSVIEWLNEEKVVEKLVACLDPSKDEEVHCNAAQSLCDIVRLGREQIIQPQDSLEPDPLLVTMEKEETVAQLLTNMFNSNGNESVIVNGLIVIHTLLEVRKPVSLIDGPPDQITCLDAERLTQGVQSVISAIIPRLRDFHDLLLNPPKQRYSSMPTTIGKLEPPLGNTRLQVAKLITTLLSTNTHSVNLELSNLGTTQALLDLHFKYIWNNFLHSQVEQCLNLILTSPALEVDGRKESPLLTQLFTSCKIIQRLLDEWESNDQHQSQEGGRRKGFMGHLTKMMNAIVSGIEKGDSSSLIKGLFDDLPESTKKDWEAFLSGKLAEANKRNTVELIRGHPLASSSEDDDNEFKDIPFPQDSAMQQAFSDYQLQQMTSSFIDQFGFNEEEFAEQEDKIDAPFSDRISSIDISIQANEEMHRSAAMFEQACNEKIQQFDDNDSDEEIWEEKPVVFDKNMQQKRPGRLSETRDSPNSDDDSTDSEDELDSPRRIKQQPTEKMDVDTGEGWANFDDAMDATPVNMDTASPWETASRNKEADDDENWADFSKFTAIESPPPFNHDRRGPRSSSPVAMDTSEGMRSNAYLVQISPAESKTEVHAACNSLKNESLVGKVENRQQDGSSPNAKFNSSSDASHDADVKSPNTSASYSPASSNNSPAGDKAYSSDSGFLASAGLLKNDPASPPQVPNSAVYLNKDLPPECPPPPIPVESSDNTDLSRIPGKDSAEKIDVPVPDSPIINGPV